MVTTNQHIFCTDETELSTRKLTQDMEGGMENKHDRNESFQKNAVISDILSAAAAAAARRITSKETELDERADAVRVLEIVEEQRAFVQERVHEDQKEPLSDPGLVRDTTNVALDARIKAAREQSSRQSATVITNGQKHLHNPERE